jgi:hypothetical protein
MGKSMVLGLTSMYVITSRMLGVSFSGASL